MFKLYDLIVGNGIYKAVVAAIPEEEFNRITRSVYQAIEAIYSYKNSLMGIMQAVTNNYSELNLDATEIQKKLTDPEAMPLLKDIMTKLG
jgi:phosphoribosylamine-glycine ligase